MTSDDMVLVPRSLLFDLRWYGNIHLREVDAILAAASPVPLSEPVGWQPIETAPKGKKVIVFGQVPNMMHPQTSIARYWTGHTLPVAEGFEDEGWADVDANGDVFMPEGWYEETMGEEAPVVNIRPTHWMKLPEPPK